MSKNLRGYSGMQPIINLVDITASSITATNGTFTNLSIGTYSITTLNVSNLVATGTVILSGLTQQNPLNTDDHNILIHDPTTNRLYKFNSLYFSPINDRLHVPKLTVNSGLTLNADAEINSNHDFYFREILPAVGGDKGVIFWENIARIIGRRTAAGLPELQLVNNTARQNGIDYQISLQETSTQLNTTSTINFRVNNAIKMTIDNSNITFSNVDLIARDISAVDVTVTGTLNATNITFNSANIPGALTVGGLTDLNGDLEVFGSVTLSQITAAPVAGPGIHMLMWNSATGRISGDASIKYDASTDILTLPRILATTSGNIYDLTVSNEFIQSVRLSDTTSNLNFNIQFINASNRLRESNGLTYNPLNNKLYATNINSTDVTITGEIIQSNAQLDITSNLEFDIPFLNSSNQLRYSKGLVYNPAYERLTLTTLDVTNFTPTNLTVSNNLIINNEIQINQAQATASNDFKLMFLNASDYVRVSQTTEPLTFNPSSGLLKSSNLTLTDVFEIKQQTNPADTLFKIFETGTTKVTYISGVDPVTNYNIGFWHDGHTRYVAKDFHKFYVNGVTSNEEVFRVSSNFVQFFYNLSMEGNSRFRFTDTEPTVIGDKGILEWRQQQQGGTVTKVRLTGYQDANNAFELHFDIFGAGDRIKMTTTGVELYADNHGEDVECPVFFGEATTGSLYEISKDNTHLTYNPSSNTLTTNNIELTDDLTVTGNTNLQGDTTITAVNSTVSNNNRIPFIEGGTGTGRLCESNLYYNPSNQTLVSSTVLGTTAVNSPTFTITGTNNGQVSINATYGMFFTHNDGYVFRIGSNWKLRIGNTTTTIYNDLQLQSNLTVDGDVTLNNITSPTADSEFPFIIFNQGSGILKVTETNTSYNPVSNKLSVPLLDVERIRHGGAVGKLDLNTIEIFIGPNNTSLYSSEDDNGANIGVWGYAFLSSPVFLKFKSNDASITRQRLTHATRVSSVWNWETVLNGFPPNQTIDTTYFSKYFYMSDAGYNDTTWRMKTRVRIRNLSNNRIAPRMILRRTRGGTNAYYDSSEFIHYIRTGLANFSTVECYHIIDDVQSTDEYYLILQVARGGSSTFTSQLSSTEWEIQNFYQEFHYLGSQPRNNVINPSDPSIIQ